MRIAVALSGGMDSSVAAALLLERGYDVLGVHMLIAPESGMGGGSAEKPGHSALRAARTVADVLEIPFHFIDLREAFEREVLRTFERQYRLGRTPSPCIRCNRRIKFGALWEFSKSLGADRFATGHYARVLQRPQGIHHLFRGLDPDKDQSYFLFAIRPQVLKHLLFPLGEWTKDEVRRYARERGLASLDSTDSQDLCFLGSQHYLGFLESRSRAEARAPGEIVQVLTGEVLGHHQGIHRYTIGQRRGLGIGGSAEPMYVVDLDAASGRVLVGPRHSLLSVGCEISHCNWLSGKDPEGAFGARVQIRYRHEAVEARVEPLDGRRARVVFPQPESAVTPGQAAVVYINDEVLGGGWIQTRQRA